MRCKTLSYLQIDWPHPRTRSHFTFFRFQTGIATELNLVGLDETLQEIQRIRAETDVWH